MNPQVPVWIARNFSRRVKFQRGHSVFGLERAIIKCIETDPNKRYPFMSVLVWDLKASLYL